MTRKKNKSDFATPSERFAKLSCELTNKEFKVPKDGWYQIVPLGEYEAIAKTPEGNKRVIQVITKESLEHLANSFHGEQLIDYEHFSSDPDKETRAAGWITNVKARTDGLYATIRWSSEGKQDVEGGSYRYISPCFDEVIELTKNRCVPTRLSGAGITNKPNMDTLAPLSNRKAGSGNPNNTQNVNNMNYKELLLKVLGLAADASDEDIQSAADKANLTDSESNAEEVELLNSQLKQLSEDYAELALTGFALENKEAEKAVRETLINNRKQGLVLLNGMKELADSKQPKQTSLMNRAKVTTPKTSTEISNAAKNDQARAVQIRNRAAVIQKTEKISWGSAWNRAEAENSAK